MATLAPAVALACLAATAAAPPLRAVVTGATGYVGAELVHQLVGGGHATTAVARPGDGPRVAAALPAAVRVVEADPADAAALARVLAEARAEVLFGVAAVFRRGLPPAEADAQMAVPTVRLATAAAEACAAAPSRPRLVLTSSMAAVRGPGQRPAAGEGAPFCAADWNRASRRRGGGMQPYQWAKASAERRALRVCARRGVEAVSLCPGMVVGPPRDARCASPSCELVRAWLRAEAPVEARLYVDVRDVAAAHIAAARAQLPPGARALRLLLVASEARADAREVAEALRSVAERAGAPNAAAIRPDDAYAAASARGGGSGAAVRVGAREVDEGGARARLSLGGAYIEPARSMREMAEVLLPTCAPQTRC